MSVKPSTKKRLWGVLRHIITAVGGYYVAKGKIDQSTVDIVIGVITGAAGVTASVLAPSKADDINPPVR